MIDLNRFIAPPNETRPYLKRPFNLDGKSIVCSGFFMLYTNENPAFKPPKDEEWSPYINSVIEKIEQTQCQPLATPFGFYHQPETCHTCQGQKRIHVKTCPECKGTGSVTLHNQHSTYIDIECQTCDASGYLVTTDQPPNQYCHACYGTGDFYQHHLKFEILGLEIAPLKAAIIKEFDNLTLFADHEKKQLIFKSIQANGVIVAGY
jgi:hypothetical protein